MESQNKELALALIQLAWADRFWAPEEEQLVVSMLLRLGCNPVELAEQKVLLQQPGPALELVLPDHETRLKAMRMFLAVAFADRVLASEELSYILRMAERLEITSSELERLRQEALRPPAGS